MSKHDGAATMSELKADPSRVADAFVDQATSGKVDLHSLQGKLDGLARTAVIDSFDVSEEAVSIDDTGRFSGEGTVYVTLEYPEDVTIGEELPISFEGKVDPRSGAIDFESVEVDTSPFASS